MRTGCALRSCHRLPGEAVSRSRSVEFAFGPLRREVSARGDYFNALLGVIGDFAIKTGHTVIYSEPDFPVVELAQQLRKWLSNECPPGSFEYTTLEAEDSPFIWFRPGPGGWIVGASALQGATGDYPLEALQAGARAFVEAVKTRARDEVGLDVTGVVENGSHAVRRRE